MCASKNLKQIRTVPRKEAATLLPATNLPMKSSTTTAITLYPAFFWQALLQLAVLKPVSNDHPGCKAKLFIALHRM